MLVRCSRRKHEKKRQTRTKMKRKKKRKAHNRQNICSIGIFIIFGRSLSLSLSCTLRLSVLPFSHILQLEIRGSHSVDITCCLIPFFVSFAFFRVTKFKDGKHWAYPTHTNSNITSCRRHEYLYFTECRRVLAWASRYARNSVIFICIVTMDIEFCAERAKWTAKRERNACVRETQHKMQCIEKKLQRNEDDDEEKHERKEPRREKKSDRHMHSAHAFETKCTSHRSRNAIGPETDASLTHTHTRASRALSQIQDTRFSWREEKFHWNRNRWDMRREASSPFLIRTTSSRVYVWLLLIADSTPVQALGDERQPHSMHRNVYKYDMNNSLTTLLLRCSTPVWGDM